MMTYERMHQLWEKKQKDRWQKVYDKAFCAALEEGHDLNEAAAQAIAKVMQTTTNMMEKY